MNLQLDDKLYRWLYSLNLFPTEKRKLKNGKIEIPLSITISIENGIFILNLLQILTKKNPNSVSIPQANHLKNQNTPSTRIYNWNLLNEYLKLFDYKISDSMIKKIVDGNIPVFNDFFQELYDFFVKKDNNELNKSKKETLSEMKSIVKDNQESISKIYGQDSMIQDKFNDSIDLLGLDFNQNPNISKNLLEFLVLTLSKCLGLTVPQAASLFTKNTKYLAHVIAKGLKGNFDQIIEYYINLRENIDVILNFLIGDNKFEYLNSFLQVIKPGLLSKCLEVANFCSDFLAELSERFSTSNLLNDSRNWFFKKNGGLSACLLCIKRHPDTLNKIIKVLKGFGKLNLIETFTEKMREILENEKDYILICSKIFFPFCQSFSNHNELINSGIINYWFDLSMNLINKESDYELNIYTYTFLVDIWLNFPILFSNNEEKTMFFISKLKKSCQKGQLESTSTLGNMFKLLEYLGHTRNSYAPMIYKTITFILIDNNENILIRSFIFSNISIILLQIESMPIGIFIDPWIKQIQISDSENNSIYIWNMTDFEFLKFISENNKLSTKNVIQIIDILAKVYLNNHIYAYCSLDILLILIRKFHFDDLVQEFLIKLSKIALAIYFASKKKRFSDKTKQKKEKYNLKTLFSSDFSETDLQTISMQKNALIVRLLTEIAKLNNEKISEKLKPLIAHTNLQLKKQILKTNDRGMMELLSYWGSPDKLLTKYETEYYESIAQEKIKKKEEELKKQMGETGLSNLSLNIDPNISKIELENSALEGRSINVGDPFKEGELANASKDFEKGLRSQGIGYKQSPLNKSSLSKAEQIKMALLRNPKADPKILNTLKDMTENNKKKNFEFIEQESDQKLHIEKQKITLRKQLEKRSIEQGIAYKNLKDIETNLIFPLDSRENEIKKEKKHGLTEFEPILIEEEEDRDREFIEKLFRKYSKIFRYLFIKYANASVRLTKPETFQKMQLQNERMTLTEQWKMLKELECTEKINQEIVSSIIRAINIKVFHEKDENIKSLSFDGFQQFLLNLAGFIYEEYKHLPASFALEKLLEHFREIDEKNGNSTILYENPDFTILYDYQVIQELNNQLLKNPNYVLPDGFKKITDKRLDFTYNFPENLRTNIPFSYIISYEILDSILNEKFKISLFEPTSHSFEILTAKPKLLNPVSAKINKTESSPISLNPLKSPLNKTFTIQPRKKVLEIAHKQPLSLDMKLHIANFDPKYKYMAEEIGYLLEDIITTVEKNQNKIPTYGKLGRRIEEEKLAELEKDLEINKKKENKRRMRLQLLKKQLKEEGISVERPEDRKENMRKRFEKLTKSVERSEEKKPKIIHKTKTPETKINKKKEKIKLEKKLPKNTQSQTTLSKKIDENSKNKNKNEKKKKINEFNNKKIQQIATNINEKSKINKEKSIEKVPNEKIKNNNNKNLNKLLEKKNLESKNHKEYLENVKNKFKNEEISSFFKKHESTFKSLHNFLNFTSDNKPLEDEEILLKMKNMLKFVSDFEISPSLMGLQEIIQLFNEFLKGKKGINYDDFTEILFRIAIQGENILNKISDNMKTSGSLLVVEKEKIDKENDKIKNDNNSLEKINIQTLNGFLFYLGFPLDPTRKDLIEKLFKSKMEIKEKKPSKIKKMELQMKLDGQGFENSPLLISKKNLKKEKSPEVANKYKNDEQNPENIVINDKKEEINEA